MAYVLLDGHQIMLGDGETQVGSAAGAGIRLASATVAAACDVAVILFSLSHP